MQTEDKDLLSVARIFDDLALLRLSHDLDATVLIGLTRHARRREANVLNACKKGHFAVVCRSVVGEVTRAPDQTTQHFFLGTIQSGDKCEEPCHATYQQEACAVQN